MEVELAKLQGAVDAASAAHGAAAERLQSKRARLKARGEKLGRREGRA
jgi:hypothetical protein